MNSMVKDANQYEQIENKKCIATITHVTLAFYTSVARYDKICYE